MRRLFGIGLAVVALAAVTLLLWRVSRDIQRQSEVDEARTADVIVVLGAAEYNGRPSPVFRARLDHAHQLYEKRLAPLILTTGGAGGDPVFTEGEVGRNYLVRRGIPAERIVVEVEGGSTVHSIVAVSEIMRRMNLRSAILVSDGYHIYRSKRILENEGMAAYGSPRPEKPRSAMAAEWLYWRQAVGYALWRAGVNI
jgi:uncharacterized SAM-binding protein YcdF (DUF218 family)